MKRFVVSVVAVLFLLSILSGTVVLHAASGPQVFVKSQYTITRYGYAVANETVTFKNNGTSAVPVPPIQIGLGSLTSMAYSYSVTASGYSVSTGGAGNQSFFLVSPSGQTVPAGNSTSYSFKALFQNVTSVKAQNMTLLISTQPSFNLQVSRLRLVIRMPSSTSLTTNPTGFNKFTSGVNFTYYHTVNNTLGMPALTQVSKVLTSSSQDFHPLRVYSAVRAFTISPSGEPQVTDSLKFRNLGNTQLSSLVIAPLEPPNSRVTVISTSQPPLLASTTVGLSGYALSLSDATVGVAVDAGANYSISYSYPLPRQYYNATGGVVSISAPATAPIATFVDSFTVTSDLPAGVRVIQSPPPPFGAVAPDHGGNLKFSYALSIGWALDTAVPVTSMLFVILLVGLMLLRSKTEEEEAPEETATDRASAMIKAFEEKTSLINSLFEEIPSRDPNQLTKAYFDELRARLDSFRSRALQRLNEVKQKSTTKKFFDLLSQMHDTEREVDRAAKDMLNLFEQYYTRRMRKEVFEKLQPQYKKRLDKALNQLSDELNTAQREAKLL